MGLFKCGRRCKLRHKRKMARISHRTERIGFRQSARAIGYQNGINNGIGGIVGGLSQGISSLTGGGLGGLFGGAVGRNRQSITQQPPPDNSMDKNTMYMLGAGALLLLLSKK